MAEEARKPQRLEAVAGPCVREVGLLVEQLAQALGATDCGGLEDVELRIPGEQLFGPRLVTGVDGL